MHPRTTTRREAFGWVALTAVGSLLAACAPPAPSPPQAAPTAPPAATQAATAAPTSAPAPASTTTANAAGTPKSGGTLQVGMIGDLGTIDGHQVTQATVNVSFLGYDRLIDYDDKLTPIPMLAESWDVSSDLTQFKLNLRKGVQFHSGREFTSDDVKYNMLRVRDPKVAGIVGALAAESAWFSTIDTPDKYTIVLTSDKPRPGAFDFFEYFNVLDKDTMEGPDAKTKIVGTGPFTFVEWVQGDHFTFTRNKNYWQSDRPYFDGASIKVFTDAQAQIAQLEAGALDLADSPPIRDAVRLRSDPAYNYLGTFIGGQYFCVFINTSVPPLDNKVVRQALNWALDRQRFATTVMLNLVGPGQDLPWPPQAGASEPAKNDVYTFDLDRAQSLLSGAGVAPFEIDILYHNLAYPTEIASLAQLYQADLARIGITANLKLLEFATFADTVLNQPYHGLAIAGGAFAHLAESTTAFSTGRGSNIMLKQNWSHYQNDELANLVQAASVEPDATRRKQLYSQINDAFLDQVFNMPVSLYPAMSLTHNNIHGVRYNLLPGLVYTDAWKG
ncbi:MAG: ABC transporter substrate-binding protein [Chloroflexi bacterium]|nr:ABC transporter substrate-binding protein [Chloroflexota bacterium]